MTEMILFGKIFNWSENLLLPMWFPDLSTQFSSSPSPKAHPSIFLSFLIQVETYQILITSCLLRSFTSERTNNSNSIRTNSFYRQRCRCSTTVPSLETPALSFSTALLPQPGITPPGTRESGCNNKSPLRRVTIPPVNTVSLDNRLY